MTFITDAETTYHYRDNDNYPTSRTYDEETITGNTIEELYEEIAAYRLKNEKGDERRNYEYYTVDFGSIYEVIMCDHCNHSHRKYVDDYDGKLCEQSNTWRNHIEGIEAENRKKQADKEAEENNKKIKKEQDDLKLYLELKARFESQEN